MGSKYFGKVFLLSTVFFALLLLLSLLVLITCILFHSKNGQQNTFETENPGFYSYRNEEGGSYQTTNFGQDQFTCSGYCFCDDQRRRTVANPATRIVLYFVASLGTVFAMNHAKSHFQDECGQKLEDSCPIHFVRSEIEGCDVVNEGDDTAENTVWDRNKNFHEFMCRGSCVHNINDNRLIRSLKGEDVIGSNFDKERDSWDVVPEYLHKESLDYPCASLNLETKFLFDEKFPDVPEGASIEKRAEFAFTNSELAHFCTKESLKSLTFHKEDYCDKYQECVIFRNWVEEGETGVRPCGEYCLEWFGSSSSRDVFYPMCQSREGEKEGGWGVNPSVKCSKV